jgi:ubiquinol-cytochrome c reductase cytochrome b subunit
MTRFREWLDARTGYRALVHKALDEPVLGGARWVYVFGSALAILFAIQVVTGILLAVYYSPSSREAWGSVHFITHELRLGWFVRGLHHWGSSAMVVLLVFHILQVFTFGAYRPPRELAWWTGLVLLFLTLAFSLTGYLLPWDQRGYWATRVTTSIVGTLPLVGERMKVILQGGNDFGTLTLTRFLVFHAFLLPAALILLLVVHVALFRKNGATAHWSRSDEDLRATTEPFWPRQLTYDVAFAAAVLAVMVGLTLRYHGAPLGGPADPSANYPARPEWYFLWMFQLLKFLPGAWEGAGILLAGTIGVAFLAALPLVDRRPSRAFLARWPLFLIGGIVLFAIVGLTVVPTVEDVRDPSFMAQKREAEANARRAFALARAGIPPGGTEDLYLNDPYEHGKRVFETLCQACHKVNGKGGDSAPDLTGSSLTPGFAASS